MFDECVYFVNNVKALANTWEGEQKERFENKCNVSADESVKFE